MSTIVKPVAAEQWLSIRKAAELWDTSQDTIRRAIARGDLASYRYGRVIRVKAADLEAMFLRTGR